MQIFDQFETAGRDPAVNNEEAIAIRVSSRCFDGFDTDEVEVKCGAGKSRPVARHCPPMDTIRPVEGLARAVVEVRAPHICRRNDSAVSERHRAPLPPGSASRSTGVTRMTPHFSIWPFINS